MLRNAPHSAGSQTHQKPEVPKLPDTGKTSLQQTEPQASGRPDTKKTIPEERKMEVCDS